MGTITSLIVIVVNILEKTGGKTVAFCVIQVKSQDKLKLTSYNF